MQTYNRNEKKQKQINRIKVSDRRIFQKRSWIRGKEVSLDKQMISLKEKRNL